MTMNSSLKKCFVVLVSSMSWFSLALIKPCAEKKTKQFEQTLAFFSKKPQVTPIISDVLKRKKYYIKHYGELQIAAEKKPIKTVYYYYKARTKVLSGKSPVLFVFSGLGGISLLERYIADFFTKKGVSVVLTEFSEFSGLANIKSLQTKLLRSVQSSLGLIEHFASLKEVDADRMVTLGISLGGFRSLYLMGIEKRLKGAVIVVAGSSFAKSLAFSTLPFIKKIRELQMSYMGITNVEDYLTLVEKTLPLKPTDLMCRRAKEDFFLYLAAKDSVVPYSLQQELWYKLGKPFVKRMDFGHYLGALSFAWNHLDETFEFMKYSWNK